MEEKQNTTDDFICDIIEKIDRWTDNILLSIIILSFSLLIVGGIVTLIDIVIGIIFRGFEWWWSNIDLLKQDRMIRLIMLGIIIFIFVMDFLRDLIIIFLVNKCGGSKYYGNISLRDRWEDKEERFSDKFDWWNKYYPSTWWWKRYKSIGKRDSNSRSQG